MAASKWEIHRVGLIDFWYYDDEEFHFLDGKMLLRGANGSGKSVTMQSFIPLLLDGNKSSERLDPFGTKARKIQNYLLEEKDEREERTGYLYMEFKRVESDTFFTVGLGLRARKNKKLDSWYFALTDGRRVGRDFFLYKDLANKITLSKVELKNRIAEGGEVMESQKEYMKFVNDRLFGYETIEEYKELIDLLIQLRTPKLSKDFKPTVLNEILSNSLQTLSEDDLRPMSEAIENMDNMKSKLESLKVSKKSADRINSAYEKYNQAVLYEKARDYKNEKESLTQGEREQDRKEKKIFLFKEEHTKALKEELFLKEEKILLENKKESLDAHDATKIKEAQVTTEKELKQQEEERSKKEVALDGKRSKEVELNGAIKNAEEITEQKKAQMKVLLEEMECELDNLTFDEHFFLKEELFSKLEAPYSFASMHRQVKEFLFQMEEGLERLQEEGELAREYERVQLEKEREEKEKTRMEAELQQIEMQEQEIKSNLVESMYQWNKANQQLIFEDGSMRPLVHQIESFQADSDYRELTEQVWNEKNQRAHRLQTLKIQLESQCQTKKEALEEKIDELVLWQNKKEPEPEKTMEVRKNRERLDREGIPYYPLYKVVDFAEGISQSRADYLEEALLHMGLLDALIVPTHYEKKVLSLDEGICDKYLFAHPSVVEKGLGELLKIEEDIQDIVFYQGVSNVLESIGSNGSSRTFIDENGNYGLDLLRGTITKKYQAKYIGSKARERFKAEMMSQIEEEKKSLEAVVIELEEKVRAEEAALIKLELEFQEFPKGDDLKEIMKMQQALFQKQEQNNRSIAALEERRKRQYEQLKELRIAISKISHKVFLEGKLSVFKEASKNMTEYQLKMVTLEKEHSAYLSGIETEQVFVQQLEDLFADMESLLYDIGKLESKIRINQTKLENYEEQLALCNYAQIQEELENCIRRLNEIPEQLEQIIKKQATLGLEVETEEMALEHGKEALKKQEWKTAMLEVGFMDESKLLYVDGCQREETESVLFFSGRVVKQLEGEMQKSKVDYFELLQKQFYSNLSELTEYGLFMKDLFSQEEYAQFEGNSSTLSFKRQVIYGRYQGKQVDFSAFIKNLASDIEVQENLVRDSDRALFEDILANTISKKIRSKIYKSEDWVKKMNLLMDSMNTSSGLTLSLRWKEKPAQEEEQLDTRKLVELLKKDAEIMREEEFEQLSKHFQSKVEEARRILSETGNEKSFHAIMREVLDYRKWFEFQLYFQKSGETKRELTNNAFFTLSGGEKAMAMYVPLFSAVVAKYQGARADAPRLISLDEAFAGVDETNIRDMFRLMVELDFNFMINSQILWGDYDTVKRLAVYQLLRPENAKFVTVIPYVWNGSQRKIVTKIEDELK